MVIAVRTERGPDGLEVVKEAETDADRVRLADEAAILRRSAHPGVVEVVDATDSVLRLRHCGSPLARLGPVAPDHAAAIVRAVAEIVDALHRQGIVHRRIDADHVVVSERGRPSLVGFREAGDGGEPDQAEDVAHLGTMLNRLLDDGGDALWSPAHRGVRAATRRKRAMSAFRTAAAAATRPDPAQRPTAHQFANAVGDALPGLTLPTPPGADTDAPSIPDDIDPTADLGWSDFDLSFLAVDDEVAAADDVDRNPAAPRDPYAVLESLASPEPVDEPVDATDLEADLDWAEALEPLDTPEPEPELVGDTDDPASESDPIIAAMRAALESELRDPAPEEPDAAALPADDARSSEPEEETTIPSEEVPDPEPMVVVEPDPEPVREPAPMATTSEPEPPRPPSIQIRPGPADPDPVDASGPGRRVLIAVAIVVLIVGAVAGSVIARAVDPFGADSAAASADATATTTTVADADADADADAGGGPTDPPPPPVGCDPVDLPGPAGDDGCPLPITLDDRTATVGDVAVELGQEGDLVVVVDSDCDGIATPVLLRPATGEVFDFPGWSLDEAIEIVATTVVADGVSIDASDDPCPQVLVTGQDGSTTVVAP